MKTKKKPITELTLDSSRKGRIVEKTAGEEQFDFGIA